MTTYDAPPIMNGRALTDEELAAYLSEGPDLPRSPNRQPRQQRRRAPSFHTEAGNPVPDRWAAFEWARSVEVGGKHGGYGRSVLWELVANNNKSHVCWDEHKELARRTEFSVSSVRRGIEALIDAALVIKIPTYREGAKYENAQSSNIYVLNVDEWLNDLAEGDHIPPSAVAKRLVYLSKQTDEQNLPQGRRF
jgi:hypothetical protein